MSRDRGEGPRGRPGDRPGRRRPDRDSAGGKGFPRPGGPGRPGRQNDRDGSGGRDGGRGGSGREGGGREGAGREGGGWRGGDRERTDREGAPRGAGGTGGRGRGGRTGGREGGGRDCGGRDGGGRDGGGGRPTERSAQRPAQRAKSADPARTVAYQALRAVDADDAYANLVLPGLIRRARLDTRDAALATELVYGTLRWRGRYDAVLAACTERPIASLDAPVLDALRLGAHQLLATRIPPHAAVSATVGLARAEIGAGPAGLINAVLRRVEERDVDTWLAELTHGLDRVEALALRESHPAWIVRALRESLVLHGRQAGELPQLLAADNLAPHVSLLVRPGLAELDELAEAGTEPGRWSPYAATLTAGDPGRIPAVAQRRARVQDEGSQLVTLALAGVELPTDPERDTRWLDLCAGPGGKTALLAALASNRGARVAAIEVAPHRADLVRSGLLDTDPVDVRTADGRTLGDYEEDCYDRVLVDVPCTGLGALRRRPEARWRRQPGDLATLAPLQRALLDSALTACRPGGLVAYVTCSPHPAETLLVIEDAQRRHPGLRLLDAPTAIRAAAGRDIPDLGDGPTVQLWPHLHKTDAMFLALMTP